MLKITGFKELERELKEAQRAFQSLEGTIATLKFDAADPAAVQAAVRQMEAAIDSKTGPYRNNAMVMHVVRGMKDAYRNKIYEQVRQVEKPSS